MLTKDFYFDLPEELIAQEPAQKRGDDRLLVLDKVTGQYEDHMMVEFPDLLPENCILVVNNSKVRKARTYAEAILTGGIVEFLFLGRNANGTWKAMVTKSKKQKVGKKYMFKTVDGKPYMEAEIDSENQDGTKNVKFQSDITEDFFLNCGHVPLPPYIKRDDNFQDESRYQTVYAKKEGSVAAPTAGLHFTPALLERIKERGIEVLEVTLHVGAGTFLPVRTESLEDHHMHTESYEIAPEVAEKLNKAKKDGKTIVAVGTTSIRTLESAASDEGELVKLKDDTSIFIHPGYRFKFVDNLLTNFHTPESTLVMLVSSLAGKDNIMNAYQHAIEEKYHFYSYGDAMFIRGGKA
ncbi:MAG: tRNA preQ1(34) S-adenosylmethionine ribosyltransferase-isomerase QueA [Spirochaetales bacterium]|nr:tRNA preQ1(34) S-adenosylmethionine ribosyltransferase-isomerase QueA [Candidatus Physcosoma equi]